MFMSDFVNQYESMQQPDMIHLTNTADYHMFFRYFLQRVISGIIFDGFPDFWDIDFFNTVLFLKGNIAIIKSTQFDVIPQIAEPYGFNIFYKPTDMIVANPYFDSIDNKSYTIGSECEVVHLTPDWRGVADLINAYAQRCALVWSTHDVASALAKIGYVFTAKNKSAAETYKVMFDSIMSGKLAVAVNQSLFDKDGKPLYQVFDNDVDKKFAVATQALQNIRDIKAQFDEEIGLVGVPQKKERLIKAEIESQETNVMSKLVLWVDTLNRCFKKVNALFPSITITAKMRNVKEGDDFEGIDTAGSSISMG